MWTRSELKEKAKNSFKNNGGACIGVAAILFILGVIENVASATIILPLIIGLFLSNPIGVGVAKFYIDQRTGEAPVSSIFSVFKSGFYLDTVCTMFLRRLFTGLWTILFIIPGIVKSYEYLMIPYILADNPSMKSSEAFALSKKMMDGEKMNAFILALSFIPWILLSVLTCGILYLVYVGPYIEEAFAELYIHNKEKLSQ